MILIGHYDSPFVRRVAVAMRLYGMAYEHRAWSVFADSDKLAAVNPLKRVPTVVMGDGEVLIESAAILDWLDEAAGAGRALMPRTGAERREHLRLCALASGLADKAVSLVYERAVHGRETPVWVARCRSQIEGVLDVLETARKGLEDPWWFGDRPGHADVAVGCVLRFLAEAHPQVWDPKRWPALTKHARACEALPEFAAVVQPFFLAAPKA